MADELTPVSPPESAPPDQLTSVLYGAAIVFVLAIVPYVSFINLLCCLGTVLGGFYTHFHYATNFNLTLTAGDGFKLGALAGLVGGLAAVLVGFVLQLVFDYRAGEEAGRLIGEMMTGGNPAARAQMEQQMAQQKAEGLSVQNILIALGTTVIAYPIFGGIGGAIGASTIKKGPQTQV
ncbi:MAG: DUF4199 family protein [Rhizobacter sp.]|nr:DUF4199 family protein [Chlorobiales bacterium]